VVVIIFGRLVPFVLRPFVGDEYELVGHCYVHAIMDREWLYFTLDSMTRAEQPDGENTIQTFVVR
jgi:hypothetical protein